MKNKAMLTGIVIALVTVVSLAGCGVLMHVSYSNKEIRLRKQITAQQERNKAVFDNTWKIIHQQAGVAEEYKESFKEIFTGLISERYQGKSGRGDAMWSWVREHNPNLDASVFKQLMATIEAQRTTFTKNQEKLVDLKREHDTLLEVFPASFFLTVIAHREVMDITVVTSSKTKQTFETGEENTDDLNLFSKPAEETK